MRPFGIYPTAGSGNPILPTIRPQGPRQTRQYDSGDSDPDYYPSQRPMLPAGAAATSLPAAPQMLPAQSLQDTFGLRQNIAKGMSAAGFLPGQIAEQNLNYLSGTPVQGAPNQFTNLRYTNDANARANTMNQANVGLVNSGANLNNAEANFRQGEAGLTGAQSNQINTMLPYNAQAADIANQGSRAMLPYIPQQAVAQINATNAGVSGMDALRKENDELRRQLMQYQRSERGSQPRSVGLSSAEQDAAQEIGYGGVLAMRQGKSPGDPTTRPTGYQERPPDQSQGKRKPTRAMAEKAVKQYGSPEAAKKQLQAAGYDVSDGYAD